MLNDKTKEEIEKTQQLVRNGEAELKKHQTALHHQTERAIIDNSIKLTDETKEEIFKTHFKMIKGKSVIHCKVCKTFIIVFLQLFLLR